MPNFSASEHSSRIKRSCLFTSAISSADDLAKVLGGWGPVGTLPR